MSVTFTVCVMPDCDTADTVTVLIWLWGADGCGEILPEPAPPHPVKALAKAMKATSRDIIDNHNFRRLTPSSSSTGTSASASLPTFDPELAAFALNAWVAIFN